MQPKRVFRFSIGALFVVTTIVAVASYLASPLRWKHELVREIQDADELRVGWDWQLDEVSGTVLEEPLTAVILKRPEIESFLNAVEIDENGERGIC